MTVEVKMYSLVGGVKPLLPISVVNKTCGHTIRVHAWNGKVAGGEAGGGRGFTKHKIQVRRRLKSISRANELWTWPGYNTMHVFKEGGGCVIRGEKPVILIICV